MKKNGKRILFLLLCMAAFISFASQDALAAVYWGSRGDEVRRVQQKLRQWGYYDGEIDGVYGQDTYDAVLYFQRKKPSFIPAVNLRTTAFRKAVLEILMTIPYGQTMTYGEIAGRIAAQRQLPRMSARAVGGAVSHNPISLIFFTTNILERIDQRIAIRLKHIKILR